MKTVLDSMYNDFARLMVYNKDHKRWILLRAPWQPKLPHEDESLQHWNKPPRTVCADRCKAVMTKWFGKDTLATLYQQLVYRGLLSVLL